jgi:glycosyltransferase involved in cell wall biosynthesis
MVQRSNRTFSLHLVSFAEAALLACWMRRDGVVHLHAHFGTNSAEVAMLASLMSSIPYSFTVHGPDEYCASQLYRWVPHDQWQKVTVVHCGLADAYFERALEAPPANGRLVCVARLSQQKGHMLLLQAVAKLRTTHPHVRLALVGDGEMRPQIEEAIEALGLQGCVHITGWSTEEEVRREILEASALILTSFAEGLPIVIMEALALGRPILATNVAAVSELVRTGETGWLVQPGSVDATASAIMEWLATPSHELQKLALEGRRLVEQRHRISTAAAKLRELFSAHAPIAEAA